MQDLTKRPPTKMLTPHCRVCNKPVDSWLFHRSGHTDGTPLLILRCHGEMITQGSDAALAEVFIRNFTEQYLSGNLLLELLPNDATESNQRTTFQPPYT